MGLAILPNRSLKDIEQMIIKLTIVGPLGRGDCSQRLGWVLCLGLRTAGPLGRQKLMRRVVSYLVLAPAASTRFWLVLAMGNISSMRSQHPDIGLC